jgi:hypothetical protein
MKGSRDAKATKDATIEGGILMAGAVCQLAVPLITSLAASAVVRWTESWRSGAHGDGEAGRCGRTGRDHEVSFQKGRGGAWPHRQTASVFIGPPQQGQRCVAVTAALSASGTGAFCRGLASSLRHRSSLAAR